MCIFNADLIPGFDVDETKVIIMSGNNEIESGKYFRFLTQKYKSRSSKIIKYIQEK